MSGPWSEVLHYVSKACGRWWKTKMPEVSYIVHYSGGDRRLVDSGQKKNVFWLTMG